jgi:hypothetical protein
MVNLQCVTDVRNTFRQVRLLNVYELYPPLASNAEWPCGSNDKPFRKHIVHVNSSFQKRKWSRVDLEVDRKTKSYDAGCSMAPMKKTTEQ